MKKHNEQLWIKTTISSIIGTLWVLVHSGFKNGPDRIEKDIGVLFNLSSEATREDWYASEVISQTNVYFFYSRIVSFFGFQTDSNEIYRLVLSVLLLTISIWASLMISINLFHSLAPGILYIILVPYLPNLWADPFIGSYEGLAPRTFSSSLVTISLLLFLQKKETQLL